jgi:hypothetical protein
MIAEESGPPQAADVPPTESPQDEFEADPTTNPKFPGNTHGGGGSIKRTRLIRVFVILVIAIVVVGFAVGVSGGGGNGDPDPNAAAPMVPTPPPGPPDQSPPRSPSNPPHTTPTSPSKQRRVHVELGDDVVRGGGLYGCPISPIPGVEMDFGGGCLRSYAKQPHLGHSATVHHGRPILCDAGGLLVGSPSSPSRTRRRW